MRRAIRQCFLLYAEVCSQSVPTSWGPASVPDVMSSHYYVFLALARLLLSGTGRSAFSCGYC